MKKIFALIIFICAFTVLSGCSPDHYVIEKLYWHAQKQAGQIFKNPHASPPKELERAVSALNKFIHDHPQNNLSIDAEFTIARLYIVKEEYDKARAQLKMLLDKYSKSETICSEAVFLIANSYEIENKWDLAIGKYKKIMQEYPKTLKGLSAPIYIAQHYKVKYQPDKMLAAYQEAAAHYKALAKEYPDSPLAYNAYTLTAECYIEIKDGQNTIDTFNTIIRNFKGKFNLDAVLLNMALTYENVLKDTVKAKETLQTLLKDYPHSRLIKTAETLLKEQDKK